MPSMPEARQCYPACQEFISGAVKFLDLHWRLPYLTNKIINHLFPMILQDRLSLTLSAAPTPTPRAPSGCPTPRPCWFMIPLRRSCGDASRECRRQ